MIGKSELLSIAGQFNLNPHIVEKDYALGWLLAGIFANEKLIDGWVFKGGTCLKKCFFETYRFSEDLDFTLKDESHLDKTFLNKVFAEIGEWIYERSGLEMPADRQDFDIYTNPRGNKNCEGKISYRGPISPTAAGGWPRIKLDLTADERIVLPPVRLPIFHPYSDVPADDIIVQVYSYEEAFGEKIRALAERTRPRDLYDVINLYRNAADRPKPSVLLEVLRQKCDFKGIAVPKSSDLNPFKDDLIAGWEHMLSHQLPALPPVESFWDVLPEFFTWLESGIAPKVPASYISSPGERILRERTVELPGRPAQQSYLEIIRFAAANRLCVDLDYQGSTRRIEPYSLRLTRDGNIILHAWNVDKNQHRSYRVDRIQGARTTNHVFIPRYAIELTPSGQFPISPNGRQSFSSHKVSNETYSLLKVPNRWRESSRGNSSGSFETGPTYIYQCGICGKRFRRKNQSNVINKHKTPDGWPCIGRTGYLVEIKY